MRGNLSYYLFVFETEIAKKPLAVAPVLLDLYPALEIDLTAEEALDARPRLGSYLFEHRAFFADDDTLVAVSFAVYHGFYIHHILALALFH